MIETSEAQTHLTHCDFPRCHNETRRFTWDCGWSENEEQWRHVPLFHDGDAANQPADVLHLCPEHRDQAWSIRLAWGLRERWAALSAVELTEQT